MSANTTIFSYRPLSPNEREIRLLKFEGNTSNGPMGVSMRVCYLSKDLKYNALSCEWGSTNSDRQIFINDRVFYIRHNLCSFLNVLSKSKYRDDLFFVDAISINQLDIFERNGQVKCMGDIYRQANNVLAWIGAGTAQSDLIFDLCNTQFLSTVNTDDKLPGKKNLESIDFNTPDGEALDSIYQRSYWSRLWIIQELFLAPEVIIFCGYKSVPWTIFKKLPKSNKGVFVQGGFSGVDLVLGSTPTGRHAREILSQLSNKEGNGNGITDKKLHELVKKFGRSQCSDTRDRVYGLLGLARAHDKNERGLEVVADYAATAAELFVRLLSTVQRDVPFDHLLDLFNILDLHHDQKSMALVSIPNTVSDLKFELKFTHFGHLRHSSPDSSACEWCHQFDKSQPIYIPTARQKQELDIYLFSQIKLGTPQSSMASHGVGPWNSLGPYDSCVAEWKTGEGDDIFLLGGSIILLVRKQEPTVQQASPFAWGVLANTKKKDSIRKAAAFSRLCASSLPHLRSSKVRSETPDRWVEVAHVEFSLRQIVFLLSNAGQHNEYWKYL